MGDNTDRLQLSSESSPFSDLSPPRAVRRKGGPRAAFPITVDASTRGISMRSRSVMLVAFVLVVGGCGGNAFELDVGQCFNEPETDEVVDVEIVDCSEPHDLEVYEAADLPDQTFDAAAVDTAAFDICLDAFDGFVGTPYTESELDIYYLIPSEASWADGDREVVCAIYDLSGEPLTGTAENIGR